MLAERMLDVAYLQELLDSAIDTAIIGVDTRGIVVSWSAGALRITGWTAAEMIGKPLALLFTPEDRAQGRPQFEMRMAAEQGHASDMRWHLKKDGGRFFAHGSVTPLQGPVPGYVKSFRDATVQHQTETALKEAQDRMEFTLTSAQIVGTWDWDILNDLIHADARFARIHSMNEAQAAAGNPIAQFVKSIHVDDRVRVRAELDHAVQTGEPFASEYRLMRPDPSSHYVLARGQCSFDAQGKATRFSGVTVDVTARRTTERALLESQGLYRSLFNSIDAGFCIIDIEYDPAGHAVDYRFVEVNPAFEHKTGLKDAAGQSIRKMVPTIEQYWINIYAQVAATGQTVRFENRAVALQDRWYEVHAFRIGDPTLPRVAILFNDISEKKRAETELRRSEARLQNALTIAALGTFDWNVRTNATSFSERSYQIYGFNPGERPTPEAIAARIHPEDYPIVRAQADRLLKTRSLRTVEYRVVHPDGAVRHIKSVSDVVPGEAGSAEQYVGVLEDVTEQRRAAEQLKSANTILTERVLFGSIELNRSETRFRAYFDASPEYLYLLRLTADDRLIFEDVNTLGAELYGLPRNELIGRSPLELNASDGATELNRNARQSLASGQTLRYESQRRYGSRPEVIINTILAPIQTTDDERLVLVCKRDVTEQRNVEEALRQSQKMEAIGQLTGGLAHDFNNLLAGIMGSLEVMQVRIRKGQINDLDRYIARAQDASKRAAALTQRLLAFARRQTLSPKRTDINQLVEGLEELIRRTLGPAIALEVAETEHLWLTPVDPNQLENALLNLCINSRDAMPDGGRLTIETANYTFEEKDAGKWEITPGQYVLLSVTDTGVGMTPEVLSRVFEPFFTTKPTGAGTGLGLSMTYGFVKQSSGHVRIYSEIGHGTTVKIYLPRFLGEGASMEAVSEATPAPQASPGEVVLVVDDEPTVRMLIVDQLTELGYVVLDASDGASGLAVLSASARIDILVTDVGLPGNMNGRQLADASRVLRPNLKVLFITGYAENAVINHGYLQPGMQIMTKPFSMEALGMKIRTMLE